MPVTLRKVDHASWKADAQTARDLIRIYADVPPRCLPLATEAYIRRHLETGGIFCCAHFNDRLLGAVAVNRTSDAWWMANFCVRKSTRRRGVGSRLLALVGEAAANDDCVLRVSLAGLEMSDQLLLARLGYRLVEAGDYYEFDPKASRGDRQ
ncbi:acetyl-CoA sensor PanZ family protein [Pistricoccus aurantiacus]|uniref:PanM family protein n=1 Tax=Pistricoccus aurantiacus TaxID=1883414 RepID=A0A5B8SQM7_9GAMM|nr:acetyl-CoA sensor PanZ family protein [Pistricoccus aurantiacus]QEA38601.1 PanM family protein [Pistricoccus aurantiacus]